MSERSLARRQDAVLHIVIFMFKPLQIPCLYGNAHSHPVTEWYSDPIQLACTYCGRASPAWRSPFEVPLSPDAGARGVILSDRVKSLDWRARQARRKGAVAKDVTEQTLARVRTLLGGS